MTSDVLDEDKITTVGSNTVHTVSMTSIAAEHITKQLEQRGKGLGIRVGITTSGCSGFAYVLEFVDEPDEHDHCFECHGVKLFIDPKSLVFLSGTELDIKQEGLNVGLVFNNPNKKGECGCGESFTV